MDQAQPPHVFISYSWTTQQHQELVKEIADRLINDGVEVELDIYDLKEGQDKNSFMEQMVTRGELTHVLVISDQGYSDKADRRVKGVGTESQIISQEVYTKTDQTKFIPLVFEFDAKGGPFLPAFLKSRIWIDFSTAEARNSNWEKLIRTLYGKPLFQKPKLGSQPAYLRESAMPSSPVVARFSMLRQAAREGKPNVATFRQEFLDSCFEHADALRIRSRPDLDNLPAKILEDCGRLVVVRDHLVDWVLLEAPTLPENEFSEIVVDILEKLRTLAARPPEIPAWNDAWFQAHALFGYESFLYFIAALLKSGKYLSLNHALTNQYLIPKTARYGNAAFEGFDGFYAHSEILNSVLAAPGKRLISPAAELLKRQANRRDLPFSTLIEADLLACMMSMVSETERWYPQSLIYADYNEEMLLFLRAEKKRDFRNLATIAGVERSDDLKKKVAAGYTRLGVNQWNQFHFRNNILGLLNIEKWDTLG